jgi:anti-anti-sigma factor
VTAAACAGRWGRDGRKEFDIWRVDDTDVVRISGVLDFAATVRLRLTLYGRLDADARTVVVDLTGLRLMDASAVNVLLKVQQQLRERGGDLTAPGAHGLVLKVLEIAGVARQLGARDVLEPRLADRGVDTGDRSNTVTGGRHGGWGDEVNVLMGRLGTLAADNVTGRNMLREKVIRLCLPFAERLARRFYGLGGHAPRHDNVTRNVTRAACSSFRYAHPNRRPEPRRHRQAPDVGPEGDSRHASPQADSGWRWCWPFCFCRCC